MQVWLGDGFFGWAEKAPFDAIILSAAPFDIPKTIQHSCDGWQDHCTLGPLGKQTAGALTRRPRGHFATEALLDVAFCANWPRRERNKFMAMLYKFRTLDKSPLIPATSKRS